MVSISSNRRRGLDNQNQSNTATASKGLGVCKGCKVQLNPRKEYCKSCKREGDMNREKTNPIESPPKMNIKRSVPNISSSKRSCEYAGCKNTTSKGKMYCGLHYLEGVERSSKRTCEYAGCKNTTSKGKMYCGLHYLEGVERNRNVNQSRAPQSSHKTSTYSHTGCSKCGKEIISNHGVAKAAKLATYTPASGWIGMTIGMALGGLPGLFLGGLMGGSAGYHKALEDKQICFDCKYK